MTSASVPAPLHATTYDRADCRTGVVHLGYGAFHRAHQAVYLDDYMEATGDLGWGVAAVNLRRSEAEAFARSASASAGGGYVLKTLAPDGGVRFRLVRPHLEFADWSADPEAAERLVARPGVRAVTVTVTESGYALDERGGLNRDDPAIAAELAGGAPRTVYAYLADALERRAAGAGEPVVVACCDNIRSNGRMLEANFLAYLEHAGRRELASWVRANAAFPCSMVDRITPRATDALAEEVGGLFPEWALGPVHGEDYLQWVLERPLAGPLAGLERVGVEVVDDVVPYEEAKIRILNGGHVGLAYLGALAGHTTFDQAMRDPALRPHFDGWTAREILPGLDIDLPFDKSAYSEKVAERFGNASIADSLERICADGFSKFTIFIRPTLASCLERGISPVFGYDCIAAWYVYARRAEAGRLPVAYHEPNRDLLQPLLASGREEAFARLRPLWGELPDAWPEFVPGVVGAIGRMEERWPA